MGSKGEIAGGGTPDGSSRRERRKTKFSFANGMFVLGGVLGLSAITGILVAGGSGLDVTAIAAVAAPFAVSAAILLAAPIALRRRRRKRQEAVVGMSIDLDELRSDPALVDQLRERVVSVGIVRIGDQDGGRYNDTTREHIQSFVITRDGENADIETHVDGERVISGARRLAMLLDVPLIDGRDSLQQAFSPAELAGVDDDLRVIESEPMCRTTKTEPEPSRGDPERERARRGSRARQRT